MNVGQDVGECFLSTTHLTLPEIGLEELLQTLPDLFRLKDVLFIKLILGEEIL